MISSRPNGPAHRIYVCHAGHENDALYAENLAEYCGTIGIDCRQFSFGNGTSLLSQVLDSRPNAVIGFNSQLDHAWIGSEPFLKLALQNQIPVVQWILDHPSSRWPEFQVSTTENSAYTFHSRYSERYFRHFCLPGSVTNVVAGVGPNKRSRVPGLTRRDFLRRDYSCLIALNLCRLGKSSEQIQDEIDALEPKMRDAVMGAFLLAKDDLILPIESHACAVLAELGILLKPRELHGFVQMIEDRSEERR